MGCKPSKQQHPVTASKNAKKGQVSPTRGNMSDKSVPVIVIEEVATMKRQKEIDKELAEAKAAEEAKKAAEKEAAEKEAAEKKAAEKEAQRAAEQKAAEARAAEKAIRELEQKVGEIQQKQDTVETKTTEPNVSSESDEPEKVVDQPIDKSIEEQKTKVESVQALPEANVEEFKPDVVEKKEIAQVEEPKAVDAPIQAQIEEKKEAEEVTKKESEAVQGENNEIIPATEQVEKETEKPVAAPGVAEVSKEAQVLTETVENKQVSSTDHGIVQVQEAPAIPASVAAVIVTEKEDDIQVVNQVIDDLFSNILQELSHEGFSSPKVETVEEYKMEVDTETIEKKELHQSDDQFYTPTETVAKELVHEQSVTETSKPMEVIGQKIEKSSSNQELSSRKGSAKSQKSLTNPNPKPAPETKSRTASQVSLSKKTNAAQSTDKLEKSRQASKSSLKSTTALDRPKSTHSLKKEPVAERPKSTHSLSKEERPKSTHSLKKEPITERSKSIHSLSKEKATSANALASKPIQKQPSQQSLKSAKERAKSNTSVKSLKGEDKKYISTASIANSKHALEKGQR